MLSFEPCFGPWKGDVHAVAMTRNNWNSECPFFKMECLVSPAGFLLLLPSFTWSWIQDAIKSFLSFSTAFCDCIVNYFYQFVEPCFYPGFSYFLLYEECFSAQLFYVPLARAACFSLSLSCDDVCISDCICISALSLKRINSINLVQTSQTPCSLHLLDWKVPHWMLISTKEIIS